MPAASCSVDASAGIVRLVPHPKARYLICKLDLAIAEQHDSSTIDHGGVSVLFGNGDGTFQAAKFFGISVFPTSITAGDLNGDGKPDLIASSFTSVLGLSSNVLNVMIGDSAGNLSVHSFTVAKTKGSAPSIFPLPVTIVDFDGDGKADVAEISGKSVSILRGNGDGHFPRPVPRVLSRAVLSGTAVFRRRDRSVRVSYWRFQRGRQT